jgi:hypothetical protein
MGLSDSAARVVTLALLLMPWFVSCVTRGPAMQENTGRSWVEAEALFRKDPRWLGADAALTIPLDADRTLWLFGDTFIATSNANLRTESTMIRNTVAVQTGMDPRTASVSFHWREGTDGSPAAFFPDRDPVGYWPGHGIRLEEGPLVLFLFAVVATPGEGLGFASAGYAVAVIDNPDAPVDSWQPRVTDIAPSAFDAVPATAVIRDGVHVVALAIGSDGWHPGALVRYPAAELAAGRVDGAEWWTGEARGWVPEASVGPDGPAYVIDVAGAECSIHWDKRTRSYVHVATYGFGATTIGVRTAPALTGPWSEPVTVYRPPESDDPKPFVYAAKGHPELTGPDPADLVVTYATNSFEFGDLFTEQGSEGLYWPRFVTVPMGR